MISRLDLIADVADRNSGSMVLSVTGCCVETQSYTGLAKRNRRLTARTDGQKKPAEVRRV